LEFFWCREGAMKSFADSFDEMVAQFFYMGLKMAGRRVL
jgi:hypothetical protein